jgi:hypothetical protein
MVNVLLPALLLIQRCGKMDGKNINQPIGHSEAIAVLFLSLTLKLFLKRYLFVSCDFVPGSTTTTMTDDDDDVTHERRNIPPRPHC